MSKIQKILTTITEEKNKSFTIIKNKDGEYELSKSKESSNPISIDNTKWLEFLVANKIVLELDSVGEENTYFNIPIFTKDSVTIKNGLID